MLINIEAYNYNPVTRQRSIAVLVGSTMTTNSTSSAGLMVRSSHPHCQTSSSTATSGIQPASSDVPSTWTPLPHRLTSSSSPLPSSAVLHLLRLVRLGHVGAAAGAGAVGGERGHAGRHPLPRVPPTAQVHRIGTRAARQTGEGGRATLDPSMREIGHIPRRPSHMHPFHLRSPLCPCPC